MDEKEIKHLEWLYLRMVYVLGEDERSDYMIKFKSIIDDAKRERTLSLSLQCSFEQWLRKRNQK